MTTRTEDEWICQGCGKQFGRHDMWFEGGVCGGCNEQHKTTCQLEPEAKVAPPLEITKVLTLCTSHISQHDDELLLAGCDPEIGVWFQLRYQKEKDTVGYMVHVHCEDIEGSDREKLYDDGWSPAIAAIQQFAKDNGCDYIRLDPDCPSVDGLETFDW